MQMIYMWIAIAVVMGLAEFVAPTLITVWFVVGALAALAVGVFTPSIAIQVVMFVVVSVLCLVLLRPQVMKNRQHGQSHEVTQIGLSAVVTEAIDNATGTGRVETPDRMSWAAISAHGQPLAPGTQVRVVDQRSVRLVVEPIGSQAALRQPGTQQPVGQQTALRQPGAQQPVEPQPAIRQSATLQSAAQQPAAQQQAAQHPAAQRPATRRMPEQSD